MVHSNNNQLEDTKGCTKEIERDTNPLHLLLLLVKRLFFLPGLHAGNTKECAVENLSADLIAVTRDIETCRVNSIGRFAKKGLINCSMY